MTTPKPDPRRPWKAIAAAVSAGLAALLAYSDVLPTPVTIAAGVGVAMLATYIVPNPSTPET